MEEILVRAGCFVAIIVLGCILRQTGVFGPNAVNILSKIVLKITLPAAIIVNFAGKPIDSSLLLVTLLSFGSGVLFMLGGYLSRLRRDRAEKAFAVLNTTGYNIGCFALPFVQTFFGAEGILAASMFDVGGALLGAGGAFAVAQLVKDGRFSLKRLLGTLVRSIPLDAYILMTVLGLCSLRLPGPVVELAEIAAGANGFLAMLTIGVGLRLNIDRTQLGSMFGTIAIRVAVAGALTALCWYALPFDHEVKKAVTLMAFSPIASVAVPYTAELGGDVGLSGAMNTVSVFCSILFMVALLLLFL